MEYPLPHNPGWSSSHRLICSEPVHHNDRRLPIIEPEEVSPGVVFDYNESNEVVGTEMLHLPKRSSNLDLSVLELETA